MSVEDVAGQLSAGEGKLPEVDAALAGMNVEGIKAAGVGVAEDSAKLIRSVAGLMGMLNEALGPYAAARQSFDEARQLIEGGLEGSERLSTTELTLSFRIEDQGLSDIVGGVLRLTEQLSMAHRAFESASTALHQDLTGIIALNGLVERVRYQNVYTHDLTAEVRGMF